MATPFVLKSVYKRYSFFTIYIFQYYIYIYQIYKYISLIIHHFPAKHMAISQIVRPVNSDTDRLKIIGLYPLMNLWYSYGTIDRVFTLSPFTYSLSKNISWQMAYLHDRLFSTTKIYFMILIVFRIFSSF